MSSANRPTSNKNVQSYGNDIAIYDNRKWIERRKDGGRKKRSMWKGRTPHPFSEAEGLSLKPINASQEKGFKPPRKKRGRKLR